MGPDSQGLPGHTPAPALHGGRRPPGTGLLRQAVCPTGSLLGPAHLLRVSLPFSALAGDGAGGYRFGCLPLQRLHYHPGKPVDGRAHGDPVGTLERLADGAQSADATGTGDLCGKRRPGVRGQGLRLCRSAGRTGRVAAESPSSDGQESPVRSQEVSPSIGSGLPRDVAPLVSRAGCDSRFRARVIGVCR